MSRALLCSEIKKMVCLDKYNAEVFKQGKFVVLHFKNKNEKLEDECLDFLRDKGIKIIPETIPTNEYFKLSRY